MSQPLFIENKKFISTKEASKLSGYTSDYIEQLSRAGKIESMLVGHVRLVEEKSFLAFVVGAEYKGFGTPAPTLASVEEFPVLTDTPETLDVPHPVTTTPTPAHNIASPYRSPKKLPAASTLVGIFFILLGLFALETHPAYARKTYDTLARVPHTVLSLEGVVVKILADGTRDTLNMTVRGFETFARTAPRQTYNTLAEVPNTVLTFVTHPIKTIQAVVQNIHTFARTLVNINSTITGMYTTGAEKTVALTLGGFDTVVSATQQLARNTQSVFKKSLAAVAESFNAPSVGTTTPSTPTFFERMGIFFGRVRLALRSWLGITNTPQTVINLPSNTSPTLPPSTVTQPIVQGPERTIETRTITTNTVSGITFLDMTNAISGLRAELLPKIRIAALSPDNRSPDNFLELSGGTLTGTLTGTSLSLSNNLSALSANIDSGTLVIDDINNRVGVGTTSPTDTLSVNGPVYLVNTTPGATGNRLYSDSLGDLYWSGNLVGGGAVGTWTSAGGDVYRPTGNVGIGTTSPYAKLSVAGDLALTGGLYDNNATRGTNGAVLWSTGTGLTWVATTTLGLAGFPVDYINSSSTIAHAGNASLGNLIQWNGSAWVATATSTLNVLHSSLAGLLTDDHTQYALLAGRSGGQTLVGGTSGSATLVLDGDSSIAGSTTVNPDGTISGTAAVTVTVAASDSLHKNKADVVCTGTADQTCINSAFALLPAGGGHVLLMEGTYTITGPIIPNNNTWLSGAGHATLVQIASASAGGFNMYSGGTSGHNTNLIVSDMTFDANARPTILGVYAAGGSDIHVERMVVKNATGTSYGVQTVDHTNVSITNSTLSDWADSCLELKASGQVRVTNNDIRRCSFQTYAQSGARDWIVSNNVLVDTNFLITDVSATIQGFIFSDNVWTISALSSSVEIAFRRINNLVVANNIIDASTPTAAHTSVPLIYVYSTVSNATIIGNEITDATNASGYGYGAITVAGSNVSILNNRIYAPKDYNWGVRATTAATNLVIKGNTIKSTSDNASGALVDLSNTVNATVEGNIFDTGVTGIRVAASASGTRVADNRFISVTTPYANSDTTSPAESFLTIGGSGDVGLARTSAGVLRVTNGSSGGGALWADYFNATSTTATSTFSGGLTTGAIGLNVLMNGNVGIGTTSPSQALDVVGSIKSSALTSGRIPIIGTGGLITDDIGLATRGDVGLKKIIGTASVTYTVCASDSTNKNKCDYVADGTADEVEIQTAIDALPATGGHVLLLDGTYNTTSEIYTHYGLWLQGQGSGTIIKAVSGTERALIYILNRTSIKGNTAGNYVTISDVTLDGNLIAGIYNVYAQGYDATVLNPRILRSTIKNSTGSAYGILTSAGVEDIEIADNIFSAIGDSAIELRKARRAVITGNTFSTVNTGVQIYTHANAYGFSIVGNTFFNSSVHFTNDGGVSRGFVFTGNNFIRTVDDGGNGFEIHDVTDVVISGNVFDSSVQTSSPIDPLIWFIPDDVTHVMAKRVVFSDNVISLGTASSGTVSYDAIRVASGDSITIDGNTILSPGTTVSNGIAVTDVVTGLTIRNNKIIGSGAGASRVGINVATATGVSIEGNQLDTLETGISVAASAANTRVVGNTFSTVTTPYSVLDTTAVLFSINNTGNVGIGTTSPEATLSVKGSAGTANIFEIASSTDANILTVTGTGNVGIGTVIPAYPLDVNGTANVTALRFSSSGNVLSANGNVNIRAGDPSLIYNALNSFVGFYAGSASSIGSPARKIESLDASNPQLRLTHTVGSVYTDLQTNSSGNLVISPTGGNVGIGTTSPWRTLSVVGTAAFSSTLSAESGPDNYLCIDPTTYEITNGGTDCGASSERFKENIIDIPYGLADVMKLRPVSFNYKEEINPDISPRIGFIAEDVAIIIPEVVSYEDDGVTPQGVDYNKLTALLAKAIQELSAKVDLIFADVETLLANASSGVSHFFEIIVHRITTDELCVGATCVNETQLQELLDNANVSPTPAPVEPLPADTGGGGGGDTTPPVEEPPVVEESPSEDPPVEEPPIVEEPPVVEEPAPVTEEPVIEDPSPAPESAPESAPEIVPEPTP
ncbi:MAG: right-handed parallel beta-helix repeat-containing protein [Candidatus Campbellbacteria bacterium]|nr:right-handed parallel beta-helix repeat-containing protein [Candidatus Campbellbacteria bacterium]